MAAIDANPSSLDRTVRIEHDRKLLLLRVVASVSVLLATCSALIVAVLHAGEPALRLARAPELESLMRPYVTAMPWWPCTLLAVAVVGALIGLLRNVFRLQDGDPALVISPRGISFRPSVLGECVCIPWTAIRGLRLRQYKQNRFLAVQVDEPERYAPNLRIFGFGAREIRLTTPMGKRAWTETEELLRRYLARYGQAGAASEVTRIAPAKGTPTPRPGGQGAFK